MKIAMLPAIQQNKYKEKSKEEKRQRRVVDKGWVGAGCGKRSKCLVCCQKGHCSVQI